MGHYCSELAGAAWGQKLCVCVAQPKVEFENWPATKDL